MEESEAARRVLLIATGGIAVYKACDVVRELRRAGCDVQVVLTPAACEFVRPMTFEALSARPVHTELLPGCTQGSIDHIRLGRWAEVVACVPATADFLAKVRAGIASDLATATLLALPRATRVLFAPAMNREMWSHPVTRRNLEELRALPEVMYEFLAPLEKELACGEIGAGGLPEPAAIVAAVLRMLSIPRRA